jgi:hypothetical protein
LILELDELPGGFLKALNRTRKQATLVGALAVVMFFQTKVSPGAGALDTDDVCAADTPPAEAQLAYAPAYPVYLMRTKKGTYSTLEVYSNPQRANSHAAARRQVSLGEVNLLCSRGVNVKWLEDSADMTNGGVAEKASLGVSRIPSNFSIISVNGVVTGGIYLRTYKAGWGGNTQWTTFNFQSSGYVGTGQHTYVVLFFDEILYRKRTAIAGNGITIGDIHLRTGPAANNGGCGSTNWPASPIYNSQVEAFWNDGNYIYGEACLTTGMADGPTYYFDIHADRYNNVAYSRAGQSAGTINVFNERQTVSRPLDTGNWSLAFGSTSGPGANYSLNFSLVGRGFF